MLAADVRRAHHLRAAKKPMAAVPIFATHYGRARVHLSVVELAYLSCDGSVTCAAMTFGHESCGTIGEVVSCRGLGRA